jgi:hypothetical protein
MAVIGASCSALSGLAAGTTALFVFWLMAKVVPTKPSDAKVFGTVDIVIDLHFTCIRNFDDRRASPRQGGSGK